MNECDTYNTRFVICDASRCLHVHRFSSNRLQYSCVYAFVLLCQQIKSTSFVFMVDNADKTENTWHETPDKCRRQKTAHSRPCSFETDHCPNRRILKINGLQRYHTKQFSKGLHVQISKYPGHFKSTAFATSLTTILVWPFFASQLNFDSDWTSRLRSLYAGWLCIGARRQSCADVVECCTLTDVRKLLLLLLLLLLMQRALQTATSKNGQLITSTTPRVVRQSSATRTESRPHDELAVPTRRLVTLAVHYTPAVPPQYTRRVNGLSTICLPTTAVAVWRTGSALVLINEVNLRWARLVLGWVTVSVFDSRRRHFTSVCNQPPRSTQPSTLRGMVKWIPAKGRWCSVTGE